MTRAQGFSAAVVARIPTVAVFRTWNTSAGMYACNCIAASEKVLLLEGTSSGPLELKRGEVVEDDDDVRASVPCQQNPNP